ncbi:DUF3592 domain-containing protein [Actinophytocola oryzae]|uniref:Uncharacterized protein DUF3592 n=1 Tax=Actinophytocola oryzae TaxID=502181 RepID=A0A4R7W4P2_9PSEU|nr:DUF3592 domain-containing protein [Actinophytocola oryzae]TDV57676.1 uncharacterized protein DUF3592 [Actinophytocola oryzae]
MPRSIRRVLVWVFAIQVLWSGVTAVIMAVVWRNSIGEPDVSYPCDDGGTCYSGPTTYLVLMLVFGGICLVFVVILAVLSARWRAAAALHARLVATGVRTPAPLVRVEATGTTINDRRVHRLVFEARPGGRVVRAVVRSMVVLPLGTRATIAYDPADPANAVVVEDVDALGAAVDATAPPSGLSAVRDAVARNLETALAELRAELDRGAITQVEYDQRRDLLMRVLEMPTDRPLS